MQTPTKYYIYLTTFPDGKVYCGKHKDNGDPSRRSNTITP